MGKQLVTIDFFPDSAFRYLDFDAIVCIDVMRTTTTLVTAADQGRRAFPAATVKDALDIAESQEEPLVAGDIDGERPFGFEMHDSPAALAKQTDTTRPLVLVSTSGTPLIVNSASCEAVYAACFRNVSATAAVLAERHNRVAILGAGAGGQLRCEDQMAAARITAQLLDSGFEPQSMRTVEVVKRWSATEISLARLGSSAEYLRRTNQSDDLEFILSHVDDVPVACAFEDGEMRPVSVLLRGAPSAHIESSAAEAVREPAAVPRM